MAGLGLIYGSLNVSGEVNFYRRPCEQGESWGGDDPERAFYQMLAEATIRHC